MQQQALAIFPTPDIELICGDCLEVMPTLPDKSIDLILCDLPYGTTACKWDTVIPFEPLWKEYKRLIKDRGAIVLTASQPFTSALVMSNPKMFKYEWIWEKTLASNFVHSNYQPLKAHENILVFSWSGSAQGSAPPMVYYPQKKAGARYDKGVSMKQREGLSMGMCGSINKNESGMRFPRTVQIFNNADHANSKHPTQKPVALCEYLIKTYTNEGDTVLDNCMGSGTTGIACRNLNRNFIGIEKDPKYFGIAKQRIGGDYGILL